MKTKATFFIDFEAISQPFASQISPNLIQIPVCYTIGYYNEQKVFKYLTSIIDFTSESLSPYFQIRDMLIRDARILCEDQNLVINEETTRFIGWNPDLEKIIIKDLFNIDVEPFSNQATSLANFLSQQKEIVEQFHYTKSLDLPKSKKLIPLNKKMPYSKGYLASYCSYLIYMYFKFSSQELKIKKTINVSQLISDLVSYNQSDVLVMHKLIESKEFDYPEQGPETKNAKQEAPKLLSRFEYRKDVRALIDQVNEIYEQKIENNKFKLYFEDIVNLLDLDKEQKIEVISESLEDRWIYEFLNLKRLLSKQKKLSQEMIDIVSFLANYDSFKNAIHKVNKIVILRKILQNSSMRKKTVDLIHIPRQEILVDFEHKDNDLNYLDLLWLRKNVLVQSDRKPSVGEYIQTLNKVIKQARHHLSSINQQKDEKGYKSAKFNLQKLVHSQNKLSEYALHIELKELINKEKGRFNEQHSTLKKTINNHANGISNSNKRPNKRKHS
ncbi:hypothetical protein [Mycoplasma sp. Ms02]|uniref:hypothetical protein n=1 Tax=Mycoplasma sp. Ms02 TaxID=353851 RepID=UPI001C8A7BBF|nr:hypothetical protein [Mycoplasma sp. Ms02]QZE12425.1 hypothetical protein K4L35_00320 [Mycoplasma sp. Ms02]